jgi:hypothetical protein
MYLKRIAIASLLALAIFGAVYGLAATISVTGVQKLGAGTASVTAPNVTSVTWNLVSNDPTLVDSVTLVFDSSLSAGGSIYIRLDGSEWLGPFTSVAGTTQTLDLDPDVPVANIIECYVVVVGV